MERISQAPAALRAMGFSMSVPAACPAILIDKTVAELRSTTSDTLQTSGVNGPVTMLICFARKGGYHGGFAPHFNRD
jgi:hypothetical protein